LQLDTSSSFFLLFYFLLIFICLLITFVYPIYASFPADHRGQEFSCTRRQTNSGPDAGASGPLYRKALNGYAFFLADAVRS
jgi:hypothetical protein